MRLKQASPKTVLRITEDGKVKNYTSYNSPQAAVTKLKKRSALPGWVFYDLSKFGEVNYPMPSGKVLEMKIINWTEELAEQIKEEEKKQEEVNTSAEGDKSE